MVEKKGEEKKILTQTEKLSIQLEHLHDQLTLTSVSIQEEVGKINLIRVRLLESKQKLLKLLAGI